MSRLLRGRRVWLALAVVALLVGLRESGVANALSLDTLARHRAMLVGFVAS